MSTTKAKAGWLFALSNSADSEWGSIDEFYRNIEAGASRDVFTVASDVWGKTLRKGMRLAAGDGIAFYHTSRAGFPPHDPYRRRPRISLIGIILDVEQEGQEVTFLNVEIQAAEVSAFRARPIVWTERTERIFHRSGIIRGAVASFYQVPADIWSEIVALGASAEHSSTEDISASVGFSTLTPPPHVRTVVLRVVRDTRIARGLKERYDYECQLCGIRVEIGPGVYYAEVHHVRPLGAPHNGVDAEDNMLVLCPNHHAVFDLGGAKFLSAAEVEIAGQRFCITTKHALRAEVTDYNNRLLAR